MEPHATQMRSSAGPTARILAVFALVVAAIVVVVIVADSIGGSGDDARRRRLGARPRRAGAEVLRRAARATRSAASPTRRASPVSRLEQLNPNLDTQLLPEKGCVNLVPEGLQGARQRGLTAPPRRAVGLRLPRARALVLLRPRRPARRRRRRRRIPARAWILSTPTTAPGSPPTTPDARVPMASTTKLMTAYLALRELPLAERLTAPPYHPIPGESLLGLEPGERMSVRDLLYGLLLPSGNDAAATLADGVAGSTARFVGADEPRGPTAGPAATRATRTRSGSTQPGQLLEPARPGGPGAAPAPGRAVQADRRHAADHARTGDHPRTIVNHNDLVLDAPVDQRRQDRLHARAPATSWSASGTQKGVTLLSVVMGAPSDRAPATTTRWRCSATGSRSTGARRRCGRASRSRARRVAERRATLPLVAAARRARRPCGAASASTSGPTRPATVEAPIRRGRAARAAPPSTSTGEPVGRDAAARRATR